MSSGNSPVFTPPTPVEEEEYITRMLLRSQVPEKVKEYARTTGAWDVLGGDGLLRHNGSGLIARAAELEGRIELYLYKPNERYRASYAHPAREKMVHELLPGSRETRELPGSWIWEFPTE